MEGLEMKKDSASNRPVRSDGRNRTASSKRRNNRSSNVLIGVLVLVILAALAVLGIAWFLFIRPGVQPQLQTDVPTVTEEPVSTAEPENTPKPTPQPTPEPTTVPVSEMSFSSESLKLPGGGDYLTSGTYEGVSFRSPTTAMDGGGRELSVSDDGQSVGSVIPGGYVSNLVVLNDGRIGIVSWDENKQKLSVLNAASDAVEETITLPASAICFADGTDAYSFYYSTGVDFYGYDLAEKSSDLIFNWTAAGVNGARVSAITTTDGSTFSCLTNTWRDDTMSVESELVKITGSPKSPEAGKTELILLSVNPLESLQDAIVSFNRENGNTRILLKAFEPDDSEPEMIRSIRKFVDDELGGRFPDLLDLTGLPYEAMAAVGLLEDLTPYLNQDAELSGNILPQVLEALTVKGGLYGTASGFTLGTVIGPERFLGNMTGWTFDQFNSMTATMGEGTYAFGAQDTQGSVLYDLLGMNLHRFVNWETLTCSFDDAGFSKLLQFVKKLPAEMRDTNDSELIQSKIQLLQRIPLYNAADIAEAGSDFASPVYIGLPVIDGGGNVLSVHRDYAVSASCADKEAAWKFVRSAFIAGNQAGGWIFPSGRGAFEASLAAAGDRAELLKSILNNSAPNAEVTEIYDLVMDNAKEFFSGKVGVATAVSAIQTAVSEYLGSIK